MKPLTKRQKTARDKHRKRMIAALEKSLAEWGGSSVDKIIAYVRYDSYEPPIAAVITLNSDPHDKAC